MVILTRDKNYRMPEIYRNVARATCSWRRVYRSKVKVTSHTIVGQEMGDDICKEGRTNVNLGGSMESIILIQKVKVECHKVTFILILFIMISYTK